MPAVSEHGIGARHVQGRYGHCATTYSQLGVAGEAAGIETEIPDMVDDFPGANLQQHPHRNQINRAIQRLAQTGGTVIAIVVILRAVLRF